VEILHSRVVHTLVVSVHYRGEPVREIKQEGKEKRQKKTTWITLWGGKKGGGGGSRPGRFRGSNKLDDRESKDVGVNGRIRNHQQISKTNKRKKKKSDSVAQCTDR